MKLENIIATVLIGVFLLGVGCSVQSNKTAESTQSSQTSTEASQNNQEFAKNANGLPQFLKTDVAESSQKTNLGSAQNALGNISEKDLLVGTWRHTWGANAPNCGSEHIFMSDGTYHGMGGCAGFVPLKTVGKWYLVGQGTVRIAYSDYEPKKDQAGNLLRIPSGETWNFRFINRNQFALGDGAIVAYRIN